MRRGARDSQVINNFFTFATIVIISIVLALYSKYFSNDEIRPIEKLQCEQETFSKVKVFNETLLKKSIKALDKGYYKIEGSYLEALDKSTLIQNVVSLEEVNNYYINAINVKPKKDLQKFLKIKYELIKKDKNSLNAGTLMTSFRINSKEIFRIYTDFKFMYKNAIKKRVECSIKVYKNHVQNSRK